jgi:hypothetical protein
MTYYEVPWPSWLVPMFVGACLSCLCLAAWMVVQRRQPARLRVRHHFSNHFGSVGLALVCAGICALAIFAGLDERAPKIVLSKEGIYCADWDAVVEWTDVMGISLLRTKRKRGLDDQILQV